MALPTRVQRGLDPFEQAQHEFDSVVGRLFGSRMDNGGFLAPYAVDVREDTDQIYVEAELPGFKKEEVDINLENQALTITAEHKPDKDQNGSRKGDWLLHERRYTRFQRSFMLPPTVDSQSVQAKLNDGILTVTLKKREESKPHRITVS
ncbi:MAG: Hsp20/alpha crystallin family protein [Planctomycetota bacterium]|nr:Hsp20/alpha crystallin family protein [Planctomycetota bacterium]